MDSSVVDVTWWCNNGQEKIFLMDEEGMVLHFLTSGILMDKENFYGQKVSWTGRIFRQEEWWKLLRGIEYYRDR